MPRLYRGLFLLILLLPASAYGQQRCGIARDYVVQARERAMPGISRSQLSEANQWLKRAGDFCPGMGDVYYYRHVYERQLGNKRVADLMLAKAKEFGSEALNEGIDPFSITVPSSDGKISVSPRVREKWALIVGVGRFRNGIAPLAFPAKDARDFAALLQDPKYGRFKPSNIRLLMDDDATTTKIKEGLNWLARNAGKDDLVVVFISSHGSPRETDTGGISYIITSDTDASNPDRLYATALPMIDIVDDFSARIKAQRGVLFLDTCFSGEAASRIRSGEVNSAHITDGNPDGRAPIGAGSKALTTEGLGVSGSTFERLNYSVGRVVITASQSDERSWESEKLRNGYFTYYLIEGLKQNNGRYSVEQLYSYLKDNVYRQVLADKSVSQRPMMKPNKPSVEIHLGDDIQLD